MIKAAIKIASHTSMFMDKDELERYVLSLLADQLSKEVAKKMTIDKTLNVTDDSITYTGSLPISGNTLTFPINHSSASSVTVSGFNGTSTSSYSQINLRVVEYTKNGKVTRVELQKYDAEGDEWYKIPRVQIEE